MIAKKYRLSESDIKKVFSRKKPFFSYHFIANTYTNILGYHRFALFLSAKVTKGSINRNTFRRMYYDIASQHIQQYIGHSPVASRARSMQYAADRNIGKNTVTDTLSSPLVYTPIVHTGYDIVCVPMKGKKFSHTDSASIDMFQKDISILLQQVHRASQIVRR